MISQIRLYVSFVQKYGVLYYQILTDLLVNKSSFGKTNHVYVHLNN